mmetsp:Transcript_1409/g.2892  ORF Transcript_1409/g.2892 Transcript_1409/m.2892 type:complete len:85 (+) Transcript_1409:3374-3628(+)
MTIQQPKRRLSLSQQPGRNPFSLSVAPDSLSFRFSPPVSFRLSHFLAPTHLIPNKSDEMNVERNGKITTDSLAIGRRTSIPPPF